MRIARATAVHYPHHVLQLGCGSQAVFHENADYRRYLDLLRECSEKYKLDIWAYCLMRDHVHLVCVPVEPDSLSKALNTAHMRYTQYFNEKKGRRGRLWRGRFSSCILSGRHLEEAIRYVETNPVRQGLVETALSYPWSSALSHSRKSDTSFLRVGGFLAGRLPDWPEYLQGKGEDVLVDDIRRNTKSGRPCGDDAFIREIEGLLNRKLTSAPRGRPLKIPSHLKSDDRPGKT